MSEDKQPSTVEQAMKILDDLSQLGKVEEIGKGGQQSLALLVDKLLGVRGAFDKWRAKAQAE